MAYTLPNPYTFQALQAIAGHALGMGSTNNSQVTLASIVNDAIADLVTVKHDWKWREVSADLDSVPDQTYLAAPSDFETLISFHCYNGMRERPSTAEEVQYLQLHGLAGTASFLYYALQWWNKTAARDAAAAATQAVYDPLKAALIAAATLAMDPQPSVNWLNYGSSSQKSAIASYAESISYNTLNTAYFLIFPIFTTFTSRVVRIRYRRLMQQMAAPTDTPDMPVWMYPLVATYVRAYAIETVEQQRGIDYQKFGEMLSVYIRKDGNSQPNMGQPRGGLRPRRPLMYSNVTIIPPT